jgi:PAS domain S-box-containing protein
MRANLATLALTIVLILAVFITDVFLPMEIAAGVGYVLAVAVAFRANVPGFPIGVACTCSVLLLVGFGIGGSNAPMQTALANQFLALFAIWITAVLTSRLQRLILTVEEPQKAALPPPVSDAKAIAPQSARAPVSQPNDLASTQTAGITERDMLESLLRNIPDNIYFKDREGRFLRVSNAKAKRSGLNSPEEAVGKTDFDFFAKEHALKAKQDEQQILQTGKSLVAIEEKLAWSDGHETWSSSTKVPLHDNQGNVVGTLGISRDITRRKEAEEALKRSQFRFRRLVDSDIIGIMITSTTGLVTECNNAFLNLVGYTRADLQAGLIRWDQMTPPEYRALDEHAIKQLATSGCCEPWEKEYIRKDGRRVSVVVGVTTLDPQTTECMCFVLDMTKQKEIEAELRKAQKAADSASKAKSDFLANMSHEIRTPMNAIIGMTDLLLDTHITKAQREYLSIVAESGEALLTLINDILDFSKIEAGKLDLHPVGFDLREHLGDTLRSLALRAHRKGLELASHFAPEVPIIVVGDPDRLRQIVVNLVGNAIKFTESGEVVLKVDVDPDHHSQVRYSANAQFQPGDELFLRVTVRDTGIGIPQDKLTRIFGVFEQADSSTTRRFGGTGLGLAISKQLVELMEGEIHAQSEEGKGSLFTFTAKLECGDPGSMILRRVEPARFQGTKVLVVDDNATNRRILEEMLKNWHMDPACASGVFEALDALREAQRYNRPFQLVISDVNMPNVDGFTLAEELKRDPTLTHTIVMMLTSGDRPDDLARCDRLGIAAHLMKPVKQSELFDAIMLALGITKPEGATSRRAKAEAPVPAPQRTLKILLAEDSLPNQKLALGLLGKWKHRVTVASNGLEAVQAVAAEDFDVVLMDVQMPEMDGLKATETIRARERGTGKHLPIIAMTAHAMKGDKEICLEAGMDAYIAKPIRPPELLKALLKVTPVTNREPPPSSAGFDSPVSVSRLDWRQALEGVDGDKDLFRTVAEAFLDECPVLVQQLRRAIVMEDGEAVQKHSHTLKGSARAVGGLTAATLAEKIEMSARQRDLSLAFEDWQALKNEVDSLCDELTSFVTQRDSSLL